MNNPHAILLMHCPDQPGLVASITDFVHVNGGNIVNLEQHVDRDANVFFMRIEWELEKFLIPQEKIGEYFQTLYANKYEMTFRLYFNDYRPRMAVFVSKMSHCLFDILARYTAGEWNVEIPVIISNHDELRRVAEKFGIEYVRFNINKDNKAEAEERQMALLKE
ncbi:MAG: formyltetrahydrofolate deformylase, partial [Prevotella sp.]|nr:formyltetrahydrofolate deformylase [Prevotella sp.]